MAAVSGGPPPPSAVGKAPSRYDFFLETFSNSSFLKQVQVYLWTPLPAWNGNSIKPAGFSAWVTSRTHVELLS